MENEELDEKQIPEKPKKQGGVSMMVIIGVVFGGLIVMVVLIFALFKFMIVPAINQTPAPAAAEGTEKVKESEKKHENGDEEDSGDMSEEEEKKLVFIETGKIIANPKGNFERYVIVNMGMQMIPKDEKLVAELKKEAEKVAEWKKLLGATREVVINTFGNHSVEELGSMKRDSLKMMIFKQLKPIFKEEKIRLKSIMLQEFLVQ